MCELRTSCHIAASALWLFGPFRQGSVANADADLRGLRSMQTLSKMSLRNWGVLSCTTCWTLSRDFRYSRKRFRKPTKCSAVRIVPGTASVGRHSYIKLCEDSVLCSCVKWRFKTQDNDIMGRQSTWCLHPNLMSAIP